MIFLNLNFVPPVLSNEENEPNLSLEQTLEEDKENTDQLKNPLLNESLTEEEDEKATKEENKKIAETEKKNKKIAQNVEKLLKQIKTEKNLAFEDDFMQIYLSPKMLFYPSISDKNIYNFFMGIIINKSQKELYVRGDILNKVSKSESSTKIRQLAENSIWRNNTAKRSGAPGTVVSYYPEYAIKKRRNILLKLISSAVSDAGFRAEIPSQKDVFFTFLLEPDNKIKPMLALKYSSEDKELKNNFKILAQNISPELAKDVLENSKEYNEQAFLDGKLSKFKKGLYLVQPANPKNITEEDLANALFLTPKSLISLDEQTKKPSIKYEVSEAHSSNIVKGKKWKIILLQNIKGLPAENLYTLSKPQINATQNKRLISEKTPLLSSSQKAGKRVMSYTQKIKEGVYEIKPEGNNLSSGEYILRDHYFYRIYDFAIQPSQEIAQPK